MLSNPIGILIDYSSIILLLSGMLLIKLRGLKLNFPSSCEIQSEKHFFFSSFIMKGLVLLKQLTELTLLLYL